MDSMTSSKEEIFQFPLALSPSLATTNHSCQSIASMRGFVLMLCSDACRESTGSDMVGKSLMLCSDACRESTGSDMVGKSSNQRLNYLLVHCRTIPIT